KVMSDEELKWPGGTVKSILHHPGEKRGTDEKTHLPGILAGGLGSGRRTVACGSVRHEFCRRSAGPRILRAEKVPAPPRTSDQAPRQLPERGLHSCYEAAWDWA